jgi:heme/copper-type cytochrome/quinol oxidase subunit 2
MPESPAVRAKKSPRRTLDERPIELLWHLVPLLILACPAAPACTRTTARDEQAISQAQHANLKAAQAEAAADQARAAAEQAEIAATRAQKAVEDATREINRVAERLDRLDRERDEDNEQ